MGVKSITTEKTYKRIYEKYMGTKPNTDDSLIIESFKEFIGDKSNTRSIEDIESSRVELMNFKEFINSNINRSTK